MPSGTESKNFRLYELRPIEQHKRAYLTWRKNEEPSLKKLVSILNMPATFKGELSRWKDGTHPCSCKWHGWENLNLRQDELPAIVQSIGDKQLAAEEPPQFDFSSRKDLELLQMGLDSMKPYFFGAEATLENGNTVVIPRLAPRNVTELVNLMEKFIKLKTQLLGGPSEIVEVTVRHQDDRPVVELQAAEYSVKGQNLDSEIDDLLGDIS